MGDPAERVGLLEQGDEIGLELCLYCGLVFLSPRYSEDTLTRYYTVTCPANELKTLPADRDTNPRYGRRERARFARLAHLVRRHCSRPAVVVDVGALDGASLLPYLNSGARGIVIEPGIDSRRLADPRIETAPSLEALAAVGLQPDVILSTQTFEHLRVPRLLAIAALRSMPKDGLLVIEVPYDLLGMSYVTDLALPMHVGHPEHLNFFTSESLTRMATASGARVSEVSVGTQIHKYGGLIPSITLVARPGGVATALKADDDVTLETLRARLDRDVPLVRRAQRQMKVVGLLARRGRW